MIRLRAIIFFMAFVSALSGRVYAEVVVVRAEGQAVKYDEAADVKNLAVEDALQNAARQVFASVMKAERIEAPPSKYPGLYSNLLNYVLTYKILSEGWAAPETAPVQKEAPPRDGPGAPPAAAPHTPPDAAIIETYQVKLEASIDADQIKNAIARAAASNDAARLAPYALVMLDMPGYGAYGSLMEMLSRMPTVKDISHGSFSRARYAFTIKTADTQAALIERIAREAGADFSVFAADAQTIAIKYLGPLKEDDE